MDLYGVATALPRHGADRDYARIALRRRPVCPDVARGLPSEAAEMASGDFEVPGDPKRRAELRLRTLFPKDRFGRTGSTGSVELEGRLQRVGADFPRNTG